MAAGCCRLNAQAASPAGGGGFFTVWPANLWLCSCLQAADFLFGASAQPHDALHEPLLRLVATGSLAGAAASLGLNVSCSVPNLTPA